MSIKFNTGKRGNVRWSVRDDGDLYMAQGHPQGFPSELEASVAALRTGELLIEVFPELVSPFKDALRIEKLERARIAKGVGKLNVELVRANKQIKNRWRADLLMLIAGIVIGVAVMWMS